MNGSLFCEMTMHDVMRFMSTFRKMSWKWFDNFYKVKRIRVPDSIKLTLPFNTFSIKNVIWNKCEKASKIADRKCRNDTWEGCNSMTRRKMHLPLNLWRSTIASQVLHHLSWIYFLLQTNINCKRAFMAFHAFVCESLKGNKVFSKVTFVENWLLRLSMITEKIDSIL